MDRYVYDLEQNPKFLTDNQHGSNAIKSKVLICNINTPPEHECIVQYA